MCHVGVTAMGSCILYIWSGKLLGTVLILTTGSDRNKTANFNMSRKQWVILT